MGAILAGGQARRFGSDKAHAVFEGKRLIDLVASSLRAQCDALIVCGREESGFDCVPDRPEAGMGPLGGLNAALDFAQSKGFTHVLTSGVDAPDLPHDIASSLRGDTPAILQSQPVIGWWPCELANELESFLAMGNRKLYSFAEQVDARRVAFDPPLMNVNRTQDLP